MLRLDNKVILVTGAGRGLGLAYARELGRLGAFVVLQDAGAEKDGSGFNPEVATLAAATLKNEGLPVTASSARISTKAECYALCEEAFAHRGRLDGIVHNAGWVAYEKIEQLEEDAFDRMVAIAAKAPLWLAQAAWPAMKKNRYGRIVLTSSDRAIYPQYVQPGLCSYAAAKMAALGIVNVLAEEGREHGIMVNAISPVAKTRMWGVEGEPDELRPKDVAPGVAFLMSQACRDGGWVLRASNGQFHATRLCEADQVNYPRDLGGIKAASADEIASQWNQIAVRAVEPRS